MTVTHSAPSGAKVESTDWLAAHNIANGTITAVMLYDAYDAEGAAAAAQAAAIAASDPVGSAATAQSNAEGYTDSSIAALVILSQAQVLARGLGA